MNLNDLYRMVDPEMEKVLPKTVPLAGQVFLRDAGGGLVMAVAIFRGSRTLHLPLPMETLYPVKADIYYERGEDLSGQARGVAIGSVLQMPVWRVK